jgi:hypothetical protein
MERMKMESHEQIAKVGESCDASSDVADKSADFEGFSADTFCLPVDQQSGFDSKNDDKPDCKLDEFVDHSVHCTPLPLKQAIVEVFQESRFIVFVGGFISGCFLTIYLFARLV